MEAQTALAHLPGRRRPNRAEDFERILATAEPSVVAKSPRGAVLRGDSLEILRQFPGCSVSLILTDPPYHSTKKANITGDRAFPLDQDYIEWIEAYAREWHRILRPNGSVYVFCATEMSARVEVQVGQHLRPLSHITWTKPNDPGFDGWKGKMQKEALRRWYPHSERVLFFEQSFPDHERRSSLGAFLRDARRRAGISGHELTELIGAYGKVNHGGAVSNWETGRNIPSREQYAKIAAALEATRQLDALPPYEDVVRPFAVSKDVEFTDVWEFPSVRVYRGKHPAEKPIELLTHIVETSSYESDIVLDCFAGSGSTLEAAIGVNRRCIGIEIEERWAERCSRRLHNSQDAVGVTTTRQLAARRQRRDASASARLF